MEVWLTIIPEEMALKQAFTLYLRALRLLRETLRNFWKLHPARNCNIRIYSGRHWSQTIDNSI